MSSSSTEEYTVEKIIKKRYNSRKKYYEYLLKWVNYGHEDNTWEPEHNLDCPKLFEEFKRQEELKKKRSTSSRTTTPTLPSILVPFGDNKASSSGSNNNNNGSDLPQSPGSVVLPASLAESAPVNDTNALIACGGDSVSVATSPHQIDNEDLVEKILSELDSNYKPEKIIGATRDLDDISFLVKWKDTSEADLLSHRVARIACPQTVIEYYENNIRWFDSENQ